MHSCHLRALAIFAEPARPLSGRATARSFALLVLVSLVSVGCRTPWSIEPLLVEGLETGMRPDAVRYVLGEPDRTGTPHAAAFPETWPHLRTGAQIHPTQAHPTQAWHYEDEKVNPVGLTFAGLILPVSLPLHLLATALRLDESERDCMWTEEREIALYFEDERLAEWTVTVKPEPDWCTSDPNWIAPTFWEPTFGPGWPGGFENGNRRGGC